MFSACECQDLSFTIQKSERQSTLIASFSQHSPFFEGQSKNQAEFRPASSVTWGVDWRVCDKIVHTKDVFFCISMTNIDQCLIICAFKVESSTHLRHKGHRNSKCYISKGTIFKLEDCFCVITPCVT